MLNINLIRNNKEILKKKLKEKKFNYECIDIAFELDNSIRELKVKKETLANEKNNASKEIGILMSQNKSDEVKKIKEKVTLISQNISIIEDDLSRYEEELNLILMSTPNICDDSVIIGDDETSNKVEKTFLEPTKFSFNPLPHWDLAENLKLIDFKRTSRIFGARYIMYTKQGSDLYFALQRFCIDNNKKFGFELIIPPVLIDASLLYNCGQLPKFSDDLFSVENNKYLSPTGEVQLLNIHANEIIDFNELPCRYTTNTNCFRSEAGSAGRDTRGVIRQHQFQKVELFSFTSPDKSWEEHEYMTRCAENILEQLELPYRRLLLCTGDTGFSSAKTFDLEVWLPSYNEYKEISSCSNCLDFQSNRAKVRTKINDRTTLVHTLNGSSLAIDRLWAAVVENYQQKDGSIKIPNALKPYMNNLEYIK